VKFKLAKKKAGTDAGKLYAIKNIKRRSLERRDIDHAWTERRVFEKTRDTPFFVQLHYALQSNEHLHLVMGEYIKQNITVTKCVGSSYVPCLSSWPFRTCTR
jgi:hypothetical protein